MTYAREKPNCYWRHAAAWVGRCALLLLSVVLFLVPMPATGAESDREELLTKTPLAECAVQSLPSGEKPLQGVENNLVVMEVAPMVEDPLSYYARQLDGQWAIPVTVDRADPWIRLLVLGPSRPLLVDIALLVDGQPYRAAREQWIDLLLQQAKDKSLITGALDVSPVAAKADAEEVAETAAKDIAENAADDAGEGEAEAEKVPTTKIQRRLAPTVVQRLINYLAAGGAEEDREEIRWLIAEWAGGPALLTLGPALSWQRVEVAPLWNCLDRDHDRLLSASEVSEAFDRLRQADIDEDEVVDLKELMRSSDTTSTKTLSPYARTMSHPLIVVLDDGTAWDALSKTLRELYRTGNEGGKSSSASSSASSSTSSSTLMTRVRRGDRSLSSSDLAGLLYVPPELVYRVDFGKAKGKVSLLATGDEQQGSGLHVSATEQVITLNPSGDYLEFTAVGGAAQSKLDLRSTQMAVGAVVDGSPLFRLLDRDNNRRLSLREQRQLGACLAECDRNGDGQIESAEIPAAIRLTVTQGVHVHEVLRLPTGAAHEVGGAGGETAPGWFTQMDRNHDGDLSRVEFLGTSKQFKQLDRDRDGLISKIEAQEK